MSHDLDTLIRAYGDRLDARAPSIDQLVVRARRPGRPPVPRRPRWAVALAAAAVVLVALGGAAALGFWLGSGPDDVVTPAEPVPEEWTTYTSADGLTGDCAVDLAVAWDGTVWAVAPKGIFRFDGTSWIGESLPAGFSPDCDSRAAAGPDGSMWFTGGNSVVRYSEGSWTTEATGAVFEESEEWEGPYRDVAVSGGDVYVVEGDFLGKVEDGSVVWIGEQFQTLPWGEWSEEEPPIANPSMALAPDGSLWVAGGPGFEASLYHYDGSEVEVVEIPGESPGNLLAVAPDGSLWFSAEFWGPSNLVADDVGLLLRYDGAAWTSFELGGVIGAAFSPDGTGWFVVDEITGMETWWRNQYADPGLYRLEGGEWTHFTTGDGLAGYDLTSAITFFDGSVWVGTDAHGITRYQPGTDPVSGSPVAIPSADLPLSDWPDDATTTTAAPAP